MTKRLLRGLAVVGLLIAGGVVGCVVLSALDPSLVNASPAVLGVMMAIAFCAGVTVVVVAIAAVAVVMIAVEE
jgi:hypothetical protein